MTVKDKIAEISRTLNLPPVKFKAEQFDLPMKIEARPAPFEFWEPEAALILQKLIRKKIGVHLLSDGRLFIEIAGQLRKID